MPPDVGSPALDVPQYWHRAAGFDDMLMAHAESKHRVRFAREHDVAAPEIPGISAIIANKSMVCVFISLLGVSISKIAGFCKGKICEKSFYLTKSCCLSKIVVLIVHIKKDYRWQYLKNGCGL